MQPGKSPAVVAEKDPRLAGDLKSTNRQTIIVSKALITAMDPYMRY